LFPYGFDARTDTVAFVRLNRADYEQASFLDSRLLATRTIGLSLSWREVGAAIEQLDLRERCAYIFHIGHVGSTLTSRLVGAHADVLSVREPMILRSFAQPSNEILAALPASADSRLGGCLKLWSRTFEPRQRAVIKATSFVSELAADLLARAAHPRAILMFVPPARYMGTIFGGPNSRREAQILARGRLQRLHRRMGQVIWRLADLSEGETVALGWACEMAALMRAAEIAGQRALWVNFDAFLERPAARLLEVLRHLGIDATPQQAQGIADGPDLQRYSKAPEHAYDAALREDVLRSAQTVHAKEIRRGLAWLNRAADCCPAVRDALLLGSARSADPD
jgi:hypothetical protein